jgi:cytoskeleton-associated protein 5
MLQLGHNGSGVQKKMKELARQIVEAYTAAKSLPYILEGLRSKNYRTRIECAELVGYLIDHHGAEVKVNKAFTLCVFVCLIYSGVGSYDLVVL